MNAPDQAGRTSETTPAGDPLAEVLAALQRLEPDLDVKNLADALWLVLRWSPASADAPFLVPGSASEKGSTARVAPPSEEIEEPAEDPEEAGAENEDAEEAHLPAGELRLPSREGGAGGRGTPFRVPAPPAIPQALALSRALRPLRRRFPSRFRQVMDEELTVRRIAEERHWLPAMVPARERWLSLELVLDRAASMVVWDETVHKVRRLIERLGAFRRLRLWSLDADAMRPRLWAGWGSLAATHRPAELLAVDERGVLLVLSDCISTAWLNGAMAGWMEQWGRLQPAAILQMFPPPFWPRTALGLGLPVSLGAAGPVAPNKRLHRDDPSGWLETMAATEESRAPVPVLALTPASLNAWVRLLLGQAGPSVDGHLLPCEPPPRSAVVAPTPQERLARFWRTASPGARKLAGLLAVVGSFNPPLLRLVRATMQAEAGPVQEAEVLLSGLVEPESRSTWTGADRAFAHYRFPAEVQTLLLDTVPTDGVVRLLDATKQYIQTRLGQPLDFQAVFDHPEVAGSLASSTSPFARGLAGGLRRLGLIPATLEPPSIGDVADLAEEKPRNPRSLLSALQRLLAETREDLVRRADELDEVGQALQRQHDRAQADGRTAQSFFEWREDYLTQVAVAWVLSCVFVRYLEDNNLITERWLGGVEPLHRAEARSRQQQYFRRNIHDTGREYLQHVFRTVGAIPAARDLFAEGRSPLWVVGPSGDMAREILAFWQDPARGALERTFQSAEGDTRFLGELYQNLSAEARIRFALLQTPDFVEQFILDRTLTPALDEFGLEAVRLIDPTCGSGHFLLGAFERLFALWQRRWIETGEVRHRTLNAVAEKVFAQVYGVDVNPYSVAIARFRLIIAAVHACGMRRLEQADGWRINVFCGDSLYFGSRWETASNQKKENPLPHGVGTRQTDGMEQTKEVDRVLGQKYHVVVGNPPSITVKDRAINDCYRRRYSTCYRLYPLGVPFTERFFDLCLAPDPDPVREPLLPRAHGVGYVGMITISSFMKREFGKKLIEEFFPRVDLTHVIDTSGAYIPGHGMPTVILFGRNRPPVEESVRAVLGIRGEPITPDDPAQGQVWRSIVENVDRLGAVTQWVSVADVVRSTFARHPWSIGGGGAAELKDLLDSRGSRRLEAVISSIGFYQDTHADEAFVQPRDFVLRHGLGYAFRPQVRGDDVRDWHELSEEMILFPYDDDLTQWPEIPKKPQWGWLFDLKTLLWGRSLFGGETYRSEGRPWFDFHQFPKDRAKIPLSIAFAFVATHNHFVIDRGGKVFNRTAPIIKLPAEATEADHYPLLGLLNSSTGCFWMKQVTHSKGAQGINEGIKSERWEHYREFSGTILGQFPLPAHRPGDLPEQLDALGRSYADNLPAEVVKRGTPTGPLLAAARTAAEDARRQLIALQEELDWQCYRLYGLTATPLSSDGPPPLSLGERAFEIVLARKVKSGEVQTTWFERHRSAPITELPAHWPGDYRVVVEKRINLISSDPKIGLIEQPEYKRRWLAESWDEMEKLALEGWLLDRLETEAYWPRPSEGHEPALRSCSQLAEIAETDADFMQVGALYTGNAYFDLVVLVRELVSGASVPYLPVLRYKDSGLRKRAEWEKTWNLQRREDAGEKLQEPIPIPPKYVSSDFKKPEYWRQRGNLDVPKERWISYPLAERDGGTLVVAWAGYDYVEQARALAAYYATMKDEKGWPTDRLVPLLAGIDQLVPWLQQWHNDFDPVHEVRWGDYFRDFVRDEGQSLGKTLDSVRGWKPPEATRRARKKK